MVGIRQFVAAAVLCAPALGLAAEPSASLPPDWMVGRWEGRGFTEYVPGQRSEFDSVEIVESRLEGKVLVIEGIHTAAGPEGAKKKVHHAIALVSPGRDGKLEFRSYVLGRGGGSFSAWLEGEVFVWEIPGGEGRAPVRYEIRQDEEGRWVEEGRMSAPDGGSRVIFGMTLERQSREREAR